MLDLQNRSTLTDAVSSVTSYVEEQPQKTAMGREPDLHLARRGMLKYKGGHTAQEPHTDEACSKSVSDAMHLSPVPQS